ncbi:MAG: hypothetical protein L3J34_01620 [Flavobacteriaceae bacterium]|nr:hypothetical protein [Flavobacteriaceae bacterium]
MKTNLMSIVVTIFLITFSITDCVSQQVKIKKSKATAEAKNPVVMKAFEAKYTTVLEGIKNDSSYKRVPMENSDVVWFNTQAFLLWNKKISKDQFVKEGVSRFPESGASFEYLADKFLN